MHGRVLAPTRSYPFSYSLSPTFVNKGEERKSRSLTLKPFGDDSSITLGLRNLVVKLAKAKLIQ